MQCNKCGNEFEGYFCDKCGEAAPEKETKLEQKVKESFIEEDEQLITILGTNSVKTFLSTGVLGNGFAILSNRRMYFKGRCYIRKGKGFYKKMEEKVVDLDDITGTGFVHSKNVVFRVLKIIFMVIAAMQVPSMIVMLFLNPLVFLAEIGICAPVLIFWLLEKMYNYSVFEVSFAGGGIGFELSWIEKDDADAFQKALQKAKTEFKKVKYGQSGYDEIIPAKVEKGTPEQLKQYKELLDDGVITQEEFDAKKKQILNI